MTAFGNGDHEWDDDGLEDLPIDALDDLENVAIQFTQRQTRVSPRKPAGSDYGDDFDDDDFDDAVVYDAAEDAAHELISVANRQVPTLNSTTAREQFRVERYGGSSLGPSVHQTTQQWPTSALPTAVNVHEASISIPNRSHIAPNSSISGTIDVDALQRKCQELLKAQEALQAQLAAKNGEIAIVRSKQEKTIKEYERELATVKKLNAERVANQQKVIDAAKDAEKTLVTELEFVKKDLFDESERVRNLRRVKASDKPPTLQPVETPKKNSKADPHRDGFDDDEIQIISPSKFHGKKNGGTPKRGAKRKHKDVESPAGPLYLQQEDSAEASVLPTNAMTIDQTMLEQLRVKDDRLQFLESMLQYTPENQTLKVIEQFSSISMPNQQLGAVSFASVILGKLPMLKQSASEFPVQFCETLVALWSECLLEEFYSPIKLLLEYVTHALVLKPMVIAPALMSSLLPVVQSTADLVGIPRFKREKYTRFEGHIDVTKCLELMYLVCQGCTQDSNHMSRFWRLIRLDFVLMILSQHQPLEDFELMLQLLSMSTTRDSIGPKATDQDTQTDHARYIIDRISLLMNTTPSVPVGQDKPSSGMICSLRLQILATLTAFAQTPWGSTTIASHRHAIGRLVKLASDSLDALYNYTAIHHALADLISLAIRLLHHLVTTHDKAINIQDKLAVVHGGQQKYLLMLARLNFAEDDLLIEAELAEWVGECAHEMLDLAVTPEEGEGLHAAFVAPD